MTVSRKTSDASFAAPGRSPDAATSHRSAPGPAWRPAERTCDWLADRLAAISIRLRLAPQSPLFETGSPATRYYLVECGSLLVHRRPFRGRPAVTFAGSGTLLIYDCAGTHVASCHATRASIVLAVDRRRLELAAMLDPVLAGVLRSVHAGELGMILRSLGVDAPTSPAHHRGDDLSARRERRRLDVAGRRQRLADRETGRQLPPSSAA